MTMPAPPSMSWCQDVPQYLAEAAEREAGAGGVDGGDAGLAHHRDAGGRPVGVLVGDAIAPASPRPAGSRATRRQDRPPASLVGPVAAARSLKLRKSPICVFFPAYPVYPPSSPDLSRRSGLGGHGASLKRGPRHTSAFTRVFNALSPRTTWRDHSSTSFTPCRVSSGGAA